MGRIEVADEASQANELAGTFVLTASAAGGSAGQQRLGIAVGA